MTSRSLPTMLREYDRIARQCAVEQVDYQRYLLRMTELDLLDRERRAIDSRIYSPERALADCFKYLSRSLKCCSITRGNCTSFSRLFFLDKKTQISEVQFASRCEIYFFCRVFCGC